MSIDETPLIDVLTRAAISSTGDAAGERGYQRLAEQIAALIASGEFKVGERLPSERNLAERFQVSRTSVREAVIALEVQSLVEVRLGSGIYVCPPSAPKAAYVADGPGPFELLKARRLIEGEIASQAAEYRTDMDIDRIYSALSDMSEHCDDKRANEAADRFFHLRIAEATGNTVMAQIVSALWDQRRGPIWQRLEKHFHTPALRQASLQDHRRIFEALVSRDSSASKTAMQSHLDRVIAEFVKGWA